MQIALGTIKRYGIVADAIIMLGGLKGELVKGGFKFATEAALQQSIIDEEDEEESNVSGGGIDANEVRRYLKLFKDSISDIYRIAKSAK